MNHDDYDDYDQKVQSAIDAHGWAVQGVFPSTDDDGAPFAYTVGMTARSLPELLIYGLPSQVATLVLNAAGARMGEDGPPQDGQRLSGLIANYDLAVVNAVHTRDLAMARRFYGNDQVRAVQLVWPDQEGRYPWDGGYSIRLTTQPLTGGPAAD